MVKLFRFKRRGEEEEELFHRRSSYHVTDRRVSFSSAAPASGDGRKRDRKSISKQGLSVTTSRLKLYPSESDSPSITSSIENESSTGPSLPSISARSNNSLSLISLLESASQTHEKERLVRATEGMTINKLKFASLGLIGRHKEILQLEQAATYCREHKTSSVVFLSGESGTGKTSLARCIQDQIRNDSHSIYISGKCDALLRDDDQPFAGIAGACRELCGELLYRKQKNPKLLNKVQGSLGTAILTVLLKIVPEFQEVFRIEEQILRMQMTRHDESSLKESKNQVNYAFRRLFDTLGIFFPGLVVMCLDDLQWADIHSLELLELIVRDSSYKSMLVIGCYRSTEVNETHPLRKLINRLIIQESPTAEHDEPRQGQVTEISVRNLDEIHVKTLLTELLSQNDTYVEALARVCHSKTLGNPFFVLQLISYIHDKGFIRYNFGKLAWTIDLDEIQSKTPAAENIIEVLVVKMTEQSVHVSTLLAIVACMGPAAQLPLISRVWEAFSEQNESAECDVSHLTDLLNMAVNEGFLEKYRKSKTFRFVHDKVEEVALSLLPGAELSAIKALVGNVLLTESRTGSLPQYCFCIAVNLLNEVTNPISEDSRMSLAEMNLEAAQKATAASDFRSASRYVAKGVDLLPAEDKWSHQYYRLSLELYSLGGEVEASLGHGGAMRAYCEEILQLEKAPLPDKYRALNIIQDSVLNNGDPDKALELCLDLLKQLGYKFPKRESSMLLSTIAGVLKIQREIKKMSIDTVEALPILSDETHLEVMYVLDKSSTCCYFNGSKLMPLVAMANYSVTTKHGVGRYSPVALAAIALIMVGVLEDFEAAAKLIQFTARIQEKLRFPSTTVRTNSILFMHVLPWFKPFQTLLKPAFDGYTFGLTIGDLESGLWSIHCYITLGIQAGKRLQLLITDCETYLRQMEDMNFHLHAWYQRMVLRVLQELTGEEEPLIAINPDLYPEHHKLDVIQKNILKLHQSRLCAVLGDHERGVQCHNSTAKLNPGSHFCISDPFFQGISCYHQAQVTRKATYRRRAKKNHAIINRWAEKGNPNVIHYKLLLDAEAASLGGKKQIASSLFQNAITFAARSGLIHDVALASERFAVFLFRYDQEDSAKYQLRESVRYYNEWGAHAKISMLESEYSHLDLRPGVETNDFDHSEIIVPATGLAGARHESLSEPLKVYRER